MKIKPSVRAGLIRARQALIWAGGIVLTLLVVLALMPDAAPGGDEDLLITSLAPVPAKANSHAEFLKLEKSLKLNSQESQAARACAESQKCDFKILVPLFGRNTEALRLFDAFRGKRFLLPDWSDVSKVSYETRVPSFLHFTGAASLAISQARWLAKQGRRGEALERLVRVAEVARSVQNGSTSLITFVIGSRLRARALKASEEVVRGQGPAASKDAVARLGKPEAGREGLKHALRMEYTLGANTIASLSPAQINGGEKDAIKDWLAGLFFKRQRTRRLLAADFNALLRQVDAPCALEQPPHPPARLWTHPEFMRGNFIGLILHQISSPNYHRILNDRCAEDFLTGAAQVALGGKADDPFSGQPLMLSNGVIASIGKDHMGNRLTFAVR
jgi:hypothetical protein